MSAPVVLEDSQATPQDIRELTRLERVVEMAKRAPEAMESALDEIRRRRLYRARNYPTFESYLSAHLRITPRAALYSCGAATVRRLLADVNHGSPSARALRPLLSLIDLRHEEPTDDEKARVLKAWALAQRAVDSDLDRERDEPTARDLKAAVAVVLGKTDEAEDESVDLVYRRIFRAVKAARQRLGPAGCKALAERLEGLAADLRGGEPGPEALRALLPALVEAPPAEPAAGKTVIRGCCGTPVAERHRADCEWAEPVGEPVGVAPESYWRSRVARDHVLVVDRVEGEVATVRYSNAPQLPVKAKVATIREKLTLVSRPSPKLRKALPRNSEAAR